MKRIEWIAETDSTNNWMKRRWQEQENADETGGKMCPNLYTVAARKQTAGRGQRGNGWESEPGKNASFTTYLDSNRLGCAHLWNLSMLSALAVARALRSYELKAEIKWPNDIYVGDRKICGILVENMLQGSGVRYSIVGIGVNVNQTLFLSDAPNPTSMRMLTGKEYDVEEVIQKIVDEIGEIWPLAEQNDPRLKTQYMGLLYRREGLWSWKEMAVSTAPMMILQGEEAGTFEAAIDDVSEQGQLVLRLPEGERRTYHFKEIKYVILP